MFLTNRERSQGFSRITLTDAGPDGAFPHLTTTRLNKTCQPFAVRPHKHPARISPPTATQRACAVQVAMIVDGGGENAACTPLT